MSKTNIDSLPQDNWNSQDVDPFTAAFTSTTAGAPQTEQETAIPRQASDIDSLQEEGIQEEAPAVLEDAPAAEPEGDKITLKVNGKEIEYDFSDRERIKADIQKGMAAQAKLKQAAALRKENEALKARLEGSGDLASYKKAQALLEKGYTDHAIKSILGDKNWDKFLSGKLEEEIAYRNADPVERAEIEARRQGAAQKYQDDERLSEIQRLREELEATTTSISEQQYSNYLESARSSYDLGKWIEDAEISSELNDSLILAADTEIVREQQRRENAQQRGEAVKDVNAHEIKKIYHKHAKRFLKHYKTSAEKMADETVRTQASQAKKTAQVASQKNYSTPNAIEEHLKSGGSMMDLLARLGGSKMGL